MRRDARERSSPEDTADDGGVDEDASLVRGQPVEAGGDDRPNARRELLRIGGRPLRQRRRQLLDEERIALRGLGDRVGGILRRLEPGEQELRELPCVVAGEPIERERRIGGKAARPARALVQQLRPGEREEQHGHVANARGERLEEVEQARVRPVDVLEQEQRRPLCGQGLDEDARGEEQRLSVSDVSVLSETDEQGEVRGVLGRCLGADDLSDGCVELGASLRVARRCRTRARSASRAGRRRRTGSTSRRASIVRGVRGRPAIPHAP